MNRASSCVRVLAGLFCIVLAMCPLSQPAYAYSVLTHEELIDLAWNDSIEPLLRKRFPSASEQDLKEAHAYAYGGSVVQDLGYYPFGNQFFSDLVHYVRSGDFVESLFRNEADLNEFAFALGALAHYAADIKGHPAVNTAVAIEYPDLGARFGPRVTYVQAKAAHLKTEFGFDVVQIAKARYAPEAFHDFIGFKVSKSLLERAFQDTYGLDLNRVITHEDLALGTYRRSVSKIIPAMTRVALARRGNRLAREIPNFNRKKFLYNLSRADYEKDWGKDYYRPGIGARIVAFFMRLIPKVGPFRGVAYKDPTPKTEDLYFQSVNTTLDYYRQLVRAAGAGQLSLENRDLDTGSGTRAGEYSLADDTYLKLLGRLDESDLSSVSSSLRANILAYYAGDAKTAGSYDGKVASQRPAAYLERLEKMPQGSQVPTR